MSQRPLKRSPIWPALLSALVVPGAGQIFNREYRKGFFLLLASLSSFFWFYKVIVERMTLVLPGTPEDWAANQEMLREALTKFLTENSDMLLTFQLLTLLIWGFGVVDAYLTARKRNLTPQDTPPDETDPSIG